jgi:hypothetical protein
MGHKPNGSGLSGRQLEKLPKKVEYEEVLDVDEWWERRYVHPDFKPTVSASATSSSTASSSAPTASSSLSAYSGPTASLSASLVPSSPLSVSSSLFSRSPSLLFSDPPEYYHPQCLSKHKWKHYLEEDLSLTNICHRQIKRFGTEHH